MGEDLLGDKGRSEGKHKRLDGGERGGVGPAVQTFRNVVRSLSKLKGDVGAGRASVACSTRSRQGLVTERGFMGLAMTLDLGLRVVSGRWGLQVVGGCGSLGLQKEDKRWEGRGRGQRSPLAGTSVRCFC